MPPSLDQARVVLATQPFSRLLGARLLLAPVVGDRLLARAWVVSAGQLLIVARCELLEPRPGAGEVCAIAQGTIARTA